MNDRISKLTGAKSREERKKALLSQLSAPNIVTQQYQQPTSTPIGVLANTASTTEKKLIVVTLDKLKPYEGNPRRTKNPAFEDIKASIKSRGLDHAPNVTQRPGDNFYTIADGGNTRLQALKELFTETQDLKFWSIECVFKPWQGEADSINSELNMIIGHLAENDIRGELSFIEKALGIQRVKTLYEQQYQETFSHRKLAEKLGENGYPISNQLIARMEQCLTYLYPHIPNILLNGLGKPQIEKLLAIYRNASNAWDKYSLSVDNINTDFDVIWLNTLSVFDEIPEEFAITNFQDRLISELYEALQCQVPYDTLKLEISLEERKLQRILEKQNELTQRAVESETRVKHLLQQESHDTGKLTSQSKTETATDNKSDRPSLSSDIHQDKAKNETPGKLDTLPNFDLPNDVTSTLTNHFTDLGLDIGINPEPARAEQAIENGLEFANIGKQPIHNLWKIYPNRQHKLEAYSLALDIAEEIGIGHLIEHCIYEPVDYSFTVHPLPQETDSVTVFIHSLLSGLSTNQISQNDHRNHIELETTWLIGELNQSPAISDLLLVRLFRLIRVVRYIKEQARVSGGNNA